MRQLSKRKGKTKVKGEGNVNLIRTSAIIFIIMHANRGLRIHMASIRKNFANSALGCLNSGL